MVGEFLGARVYYEQTGQGQDVLMLHGWGCSSRHFAQIASALSSQFHVTVIDFPGFGQSSRPPAAWGVEEYAQMTADLMEGLHISPAHIIAHSFGARVAIYLAAHRPELVGKLILTGAAGIKKQPTPQQQKRTAEFKKKKALAEKIGRLPLLGKLSAEIQDNLRKKYGSADYNALDEEMRATFVKVISLDLSDLLKNIQASTLLIFGEQDTETPLWMGEKMEREIPDAGLVVFEGEDHFAYLRQWPRFVRIAQTFLSDKESKP